MKQLFKILFLLTSISIERGYGQQETSGSERGDFPPNPLQKAGYKLDFNDEFEGPDLDTTKWLGQYLPHWAHDLNKAKARYSFENGCLVEQINQNDGPWSPDHDGNVWVSGIMSREHNWIHNFSGTSHNTNRPAFNGYSTKYGYFEIRAKLCNTGGGGHQALWLVGNQDDSNDWFNSKRTAEIDMLESQFSLPYGWRRCTYGWNDPNFSTSWWLTTDNVPSGNPTTEFHIYAMEWTPTQLKFYYDNKLLNVRNESPQYAMSMILSIYVNAGFSGAPNNVWPKKWYIDYIRVYKPSPVGTNDLKTENMYYFKLSPNPCNSSIEIMFNENEIREANVFIYDAMGRAVIKDRLLTSYDRKIDVFSLQNGIYFVKIFDKNKNFVQHLKFLKE